jgi:hypothetical protein
MTLPLGQGCLMTRRRIALDAIVTLVLVVWTAIAGVVLWWGLWSLNVDSSCDGPARRDIGGGGWAVFVVPVLWAGVFVAVAMRLRGRWWWLSAALAWAFAVAFMVRAVSGELTSLCW